MSLPKTPPPQKTIVSNHENETETFVPTNQNAENLQDRNSVTNDQDRNSVTNNEDRNSVTNNEDRNSVTNNQDRNSVTNNQDRNSVTNTENVTNNSPAGNTIRIAFGDVGPEPRPDNPNPISSEHESSSTRLIDVGPSYNPSYEDMINNAHKNSTPQNSQSLTTDPEDSPIAKVSKGYTA